MRLTKLPSTFLMILMISLILTLTGCFGSKASGSPTSAAPIVVKPAPTIESVVATTSGTETAYYATLDIKVKNEGAEGTILVQATVTQSGKVNSNKMPVFLKEGETHELKMTFPLVWEGGEFKSDVIAILP